MGRLTNYLIHGPKGLFLPQKLLNVIATWKLIGSRGRRGSKTSRRRF